LTTTPLFSTSFTYVLRTRHLDNCSCVILPSAILGGRMPFFKLHPCCSIYFLPTAAKSKQKVPLATKILNRTKRLILGSFQMCPSNFHSHGILAICP
jgi:hypothetical protein